MQTVIYTNSKRQAANYQADRICLSDRIDVGQLIDNQMDRYNISHLHLWLITDNIQAIEGATQQQLLSSMGRYLVENKDGHFTFQYVADRYHPPSLEPVKRSTNAIELSSAYLAEAPYSKDSDEISRCRSGRLIREELFREEIQFHHFKEFEQFINNELKNNNESDLIKKYIFRTDEESIGLSFIDSNKKDLIKLIIDEDCNRIYNSKMHADRGKSSMHLDEYYDNHKKDKHNYQKTYNVFHKVILFLFTDKTEEIDTYKRKKTRYFTSYKNNLSIEALSPWRIRQEDIDLYEKYEKECNLIKQEIENEKIMFRNRIKAIENYIGDTINVQKLIQEDEDIKSGNQLNQNQLNSTTGMLPIKKQPLKRSSIVPVSGQTLANTMEKFSKFSNNSLFTITSEFKRLKEIGEAMRNIDNIIYEQNKKIDSNKIKLKELMKTKEQILFENAKQVNKIKASVLNIQQQTKRKELQIQEKEKGGTFATILNYKSKQPSLIAKSTLQSHVNFINKHQQLNQYALDENFPFKSPENDKVITTQKIPHASQHRERQNQNITEKKQSKTVHFRFREKKFNEFKLSQIKDSTIKTNLNDTHKAGSVKFNLNTSSNQQDSINSISEQGPELKSFLQRTRVLEAELFKMYEYYNKNKDLISLITRQISSYKLLKPSKSQHQSHSRVMTHILNHSKIGLDQSENDILLDMSGYPLLSDYLRKQQEDSDWKSLHKCESKYQKKSLNVRLETSYPKDCFQIMLNSGKRKSVSKTNLTQQSIKNDEFDRAGESVQTPKLQSIANVGKTPSFNSAKPSKFKRITIEDAININSLTLKRNK